MVKIRQLVHLLKGGVLSVNCNLVVLENIQRIRDMTGEGTLLGQSWLLKSSESQLRRRCRPRMRTGRAGNPRLLRMRDFAEENSLQIRGW